PCWIAAPLLFIGACADMTDDDGARNGARSSAPDCRATLEPKAPRPIEPVHARPQPIPMGSMTRTAPGTARGSTPDAPSDTTCEHTGEPQGNVWDGTGRSEAVRGAWVNPPSRSSPCSR